MGRKKSIRIQPPVPERQPKPNSSDFEEEDVARAERLLGLSREELLDRYKPSLCEMAEAELRGIMLFGLTPSKIEEMLRDGRVQECHDLAAKAAELEDFIIRLRIRYEGATPRLFL